MNVEYKNLEQEEIEISLFDNFVRTQNVTNCFRKENGEWVIKDIAFIDDWSKEDYEKLVICLKNTVKSGGLVAAAFINGEMKGFASVEGEHFGSEKQYLDLSALHVSQDVRGMGLGRRLFIMAREFAKSKGAKKLYISSHSAVETQAFYQAMGCVDAKEYNKKHVEMEPCDRQLECEA